MIHLTGTEATTELSIKTNGGTGQTGFGSIQVDGALMSFDIKHVTLNGSMMVAGALGAIKIQGALALGSQIIAESLSATAKLNGTVITVAGNPSFVADMQPPASIAALKNDTGSSATDGLTGDPIIAGNVTHAVGLGSFKANFGTNSTMDVLGDRQANGAFEFSRARLEQINGAPLADGAYVLKLAATDVTNHTTQASVPFTLDTTVSTLTLDLDAASDTVPVGDQQTTAVTVILQGQAEAGRRWNWSSWDCRRLPIHPGPLPSGTCH